MNIIIAIIAFVAIFFALYCCVSFVVEYKKKINDANETHSVLNSYNELMKSQSDENLNEVYVLIDEVPAKNCEYILKKNKELIKQLVWSVGMSDDDIDRYLMPILKKIAKLEHLIPAKNVNFYKEQDCLFSKSILLAIRAVQNSDRKVFHSSDWTPAQRYHAKNRVRLAVAIAALCCSIYKVFCNITVCAKTNEKILWKPENEYLIDFLRRNKLNSYVIKFKNNVDYKADVSLKYMHLIVDNLALNYISQCNLKIIVSDMENAIKYMNSSKGGLMGDILYNAYISVFEESEEE